MPIDYSPSSLCYWDKPYPQDLTFEDFSPLVFEENADTPFPNEIIDQTLLNLFPFQTENVAQSTVDFPKNIEGPRKKIRNHKISSALLRKSQKEEFDHLKTALASHNPFSAKSTQLEVLQRATEFIAQSNLVAADNEKLKRTLKILKQQIAKKEKAAEPSF